MRAGSERLRRFALALALAPVLGSVSGDPALGAEPEPREARLLRFPDIHQDFVVFVYGGDIWRAPTAGGPAWRLTSHEGLELFPRISPDGSWIAYTAEYTGSRQVYVMPAWGGEPRQLTFYTDVGTMPPRGGWDAWIQDWMPDGRILVRMNRTPWGQRMGRYYLVDPQGGLEVPLPIPHGGGASPSPDGKRLAYCPIDREFRTWKRTRGGRAQDVWIYDLAANRSERITAEAATDNFPMWIDDTIYFTSDREDTLNLYAYDLGTRGVRKVTDFRGTDVLWPSRGPGAIVFMNDGWLHRLDVASGRSDRIPVRIGADLPMTVPHFKDVQDSVDSFDLSPSGARAVLEARGELFTVPAKHGAARNLSESQGVREIAPAWSPDGRSIAYLSDATGEYEVYVRAADGTGEPRRLTHDGTIWRFAPVWSPDSRWLAFGDRRQRLFIMDVGSSAVAEVDRGDQEDLDTYAWSPDSRWLVYEKSHPTRLRGLSVYSVEGKRVFPLGDGMTEDRSPAFSADGKHLFFLSNRDFQPTFSAFEFNYLYQQASRVYVASLARDVPALFPIRSDEEKAAAEGPQEEEEEPASPEDEFRTKEPRSRKERDAARGKPGGDPGKAGNGKSGEGEDEDAKTADKPGKPPRVEPVRIEPEGFLARTVALPGIEAGEYQGLAATSEGVFYVRDEPGSEPALFRFDLAERKEEKVLGDVQGYVLSADGKKLLYRSGSSYAIADARPNQKPGEGKLDLSGLEVKLDPRAEWRQMFEDAWRITRDWFYDPQMHGVDWRGLRERYAALVPHVAHRADLDFVLGEMLSELEAGHTYVASGDEPKVERVRGGMLGCELEADRSGRYRIARIFAGENWDESYRSPLTEPGVDVREGDFLLAVDGQELTTRDNPYRPLENKADRPVLLTVNGKPSLEGSRRVTVRPVASELPLRYLAWVRERMAMVDRLSGGRIGYIHLPDTALDGNRMLQKFFYAQADKAALILDDRYNGGGFIPDRMMEYLSRETLAYWARRGITSMRTPGFAHDGPKAMLINGYSSSGGDALPYFFRKKGLGILIGTRTWGGLIGLSGNPDLADGGSVQVPTFRIYDTEGRWVVENEGVSPDIEVIDLPEAIRDGHDPSLERAVAWLLDELKKRPDRPAPPSPPDMVGDSPRGAS